MGFRDKTNRGRSLLDGFQSILHLVQSAGWRVSDGIVIVRVSELDYSRVSVVMALEKERREAYHLSIDFQRDFSTKELMKWREVE